MNITLRYLDGLMQNLIVRAHNGQYEIHLEDNKYIMFELFPDYERHHHGAIFYRVWSRLKLLSMENPNIISDLTNLCNVISFKTNGIGVITSTKFIYYDYFPYYKYEELTESQGQYRGDYGGKCFVPPTNVEIREYKIKKLLYGFNKN